MKDIEDEIPFDFPDGWAWASLSQIAELFNAGKGGLIGGVSLNTLKSLFIPIPPLAEQEKICININEFLSNISSLEQDQSSL